MYSILLIRRGQRYQLNMTCGRKIARASPIGRRLSPSVQVASWKRKTYADARARQLIASRRWDEVHVVPSQELS